jgi:hypothetical protein
MFHVLRMFHRVRVFYVTIRAVLKIRVVVEIDLLLRVFVEILASETFIFGVEGGMVRVGEC